MFATHGYDGTSIQAVLAESGVSRGALYHHFPGKDALFLAVLEEVGQRLAAQGAAAAQDAADPVEGLRIGLMSWIRAAGDPVVRQIMLIDAPAVLGWERWRELDEQGPWARSGPRWRTPRTRAGSTRGTWTPSLTSCWPPPTR